MQLKIQETVVRLLVDTGKVDLEVKDQSRWTPLLHAVSLEHKAVVKLLLDTGKAQFNQLLVKLLFPNLRNTTPQV